MQHGHRTSGRRNCLLACDPSPVRLRSVPSQLLTMKHLLLALAALVALACGVASQPVPEPVTKAVAVEAIPKAPIPVEPILRLQIFLDAQLFGPGKIDGRPGDLTTKALKRYQRSRGVPETEVETHTVDLSSVAQLYTTYTIREEDLKFV